MKNFTEEIFFYALIFTVGILGAFVKYIHNNKAITSILHFAGELFTGGFVALIAGILTVEYFNYSYKLTFALCGIYGFAGVAVFNFVIDAIHTRVAGIHSKNSKETKRQ
jgi:hypothetical protein